MNDISTFQKSPFSTKPAEQTGTHEHILFEVRNCQSVDTVDDCGEQPSRHRHLGQLKEHVLGVPCHLGSDLH